MTDKCEKQSDHSTTPHIFCKDEIEEITNRPSFQEDLIQAISKGFVAFDQGDFFAAPVQTLGAPPMAAFVEAVENYAAQTCVKSGYFRNNPYYVIKVASGGHPIPNSGLMQLYSQSNGQLVALLLDDGILTELRTAAVGALVSQLVSPVHDIQRVGVLGTGVQARYQLRMLQRVTKCRAMGVYGRSGSETYRAEMLLEGWTDIQCYEDPDELLRQCNVVITTTSARSPLLQMEQLGGSADKTIMKCRLLICIGSDAPGKGEVSDCILNHADLLVADHIEQSVERGEFQRLSPGKKESICSLGQLIQTKALHRSSNDDDRFIVFDSSGVALQDCVIAQMIYETLTKQRAL
jgi:ornithine cyclodeaminase